MIITIPTNTAACLRGFCLFENHRLPNITLPTNDPGDDEVKVLARHQSTVTAPIQTIPFTDLPAELRNRIYEYALPSSKDQLIVAAPFRDELMLFGEQPAITRVSKQIRSETLEMFYTNSTFVAYIQKFDFKPLVRWVDCITSTASSPKVTVEVKVLDRIKCAYELLDLVRSWRDTKHQNVHLRIHNCYTDGLGPIWRIEGFDQRKLVADAVKLAELLNREGDASEGKLITEYHRQLENVDRRDLGSMVLGTQSCAVEGIGFHHPPEL